MPKSRKKRFQLARNNRSLYALRKASRAQKPLRAQVAAFETWRCRMATSRGIWIKDLHWNLTMSLKSAMCHGKSILTIGNNSNILTCFVVLATFSSRMPAQSPEVLVTFGISSFQCFERPMAWRIVMAVGWSLDVSPDIFRPEWVRINMGHVPKIAMKEQGNLISLSRYIIIYHYISLSITRYH